MGIENSYDPLEDEYQVTEDVDNVALNDFRSHIADHFRSEGKWSDKVDEFISKDTNALPLFLHVAVNMKPHDIATKLGVDVGVIQGKIDQYYKLSRGEE